MIRVEHKPSQGARWTLVDFETRGPRPRMSTKRKRHIFFENNGICADCSQPIDAKHDRWEIAHLDGWWLSGKDANPYLRPMHFRCHLVNTRTVDVPMVAKVKRQQDRDLGFKTCATRPIDGSRNTPWKRKVGGRVERR